MDLKKILMVVAAVILLASACEFNADTFYKNNGHCGISAASIEDMGGGIYELYGHSFARKDGTGNCDSYPVHRDDRAVVHATSVVGPNGNTCLLTAGTAQGPNNARMGFRYNASSLKAACGGPGYYRTVTNVSVWFDGERHYDAIASPLVYIS